MACDVYRGVFTPQHGRLLPECLETERHWTNELIMLSFTREQCWPASAQRQFQNAVDVCYGFREKVQWKPFFRRGQRLPYTPTQGWLFAVARLPTIRTLLATTHALSQQAISQDSRLRPARVQYAPARVTSDKHPGQHLQGNLSHLERIETVFANLLPALLEVD